MWDLYNVPVAARCGPSNRTGLTRSVLEGPYSTRCNSSLAGRNFGRLRTCVAVRTPQLYPQDWPQAGPGACARRAATAARGVGWRGRRETDWSVHLYLNPPTNAPADSRPQPCATAGGRTRTAAPGVDRLVLGVGEGRGLVRSGGWGWRWQCGVQGRVLLLVEPRARAETGYQSGMPGNLPYGTARAAG